MRFYWNPRRLVYVPLGGIEIQLLTDPDHRGRQYRLVYSHMGSVNVSKNQRVEAGQIIGVVGDTSVYDSASHLHFQMVRAGTYTRVDPQSVIPSLSKGKPGIYSRLRPMRVT